MELAFGCPPIEWDIDARVRDFAERMGDEYTSLYEQDTTSIKGGDFERFGAFADNHLDFIRALTKARGMDPISSDREIGAFLNTFDKLAAMPEPTPAKTRKRRAFRRRMRSGRPVEPRTVIVIRHDPVNVRKTRIRAMESSDDNDDSTAFFQDFLEGKKIVGLSM